MNVSVCAMLIFLAQSSLLRLRSGLLPAMNSMASHGDSTLRVPAPGME